MVKKYKRGRALLALPLLCLHRKPAIATLTPLLQLRSLLQVFPKKEHRLLGKNAPILH